MVCIANSMIDEWVQREWSAGMLRRTKSHILRRLKVILRTCLSVLSLAKLFWIVILKVVTCGILLILMKAHLRRTPTIVSHGLNEVYWHRYLDVPCATAVDIARSGISERLTYLIEYRPPMEFAAHCFCEASWPAKKRDLVWQDGPHLQYIALLKNVTAPQKR